jgi:hypothetical protein
MTNLSWVPSWMLVARAQSFGPKLRLIRYEDASGQ